MPRRALCATALCMTLAAPPTLAGDAELLRLLGMLRDNGTLTEAQYRELEAALRAGGAEAPAAPPIHPAQGPRPAPPPVRPDTHVTTRGGLEAVSPDGAFAFDLGGRIQVDAAFFDDDASDIGDGTELRRARLELTGAMQGDWEYELSVDFAEDDLEVKDARIDYQGWDPLQVRVGQFKEPFGLEQQTSSVHLTFLERGLPDALVPDRSLGLGVLGHGRDDHWSLAAGLFGEPVGTNNKDDEGWGVGARATYAPWNARRRALHLGLAANYREPPEDDRELRLRARPESHQGPRLVDTDDIEDVTATLRYGLEAAAVYGPASLQGEYVRAEVRRDAGEPDATFDGWYLYGSWLLTGESRPYDGTQGRFEGIQPLTPLGYAGAGAFELAARYSHLDLNDGDIRGGGQDDVTLGLNWYPNANLRLMANYVQVDTDEEAGDDDPDIFQLRFQAAY
jgi:phosphate-selective porin OprO/OprP